MHTDPVSKFLTYMGCAFCLGIFGACLIYGLYMIYEEWLRDHQQRRNLRKATKTKTLRRMSPYAKSHEDFY